MAGLDFVNARLNKLLGAFPAVQGVIDRVSVNQYYNHLIGEGACHYVENVYTMPIGATQYIMLDTTDTDKRLVALPTLWQSSVGVILMTLGVAEDYTGGTEITPINRNYLYNGAETKYIYNPTPVTPTFPDYPTMMIGSSSTNQSSGGGAVSGLKDEIIILDNSKKYVFKLENESGSQAYLYSNIVWFET